MSWWFDDLFYNCCERNYWRYNTLGVPYLLDHYMEWID